MVALEEIPSNNDEGVEDVSSKTVGGLEDITSRSDGGLMKEILKEGSGDEIPADGCIALIHYTGTDLEGNQFASSREDDQPVEFEVGDNKDVIRAWSVIVPSMKKGEIARVTCSRDYTTKTDGSPPTVPPNVPTDGTLIFEIELLSWKGTDLSDDGDGSVRKYLLSRSKGYTMPNEGAKVDIHMIGKYNGEIFDERDVQFTILEGEEIGVIDGVEIGLQGVREGETARLVIKSEHAFGKTGNAEYNIPPNATVEYIVHLKSVERAPTTWSMKAHELMKLVTPIKDKGTNYLKDGKYNLGAKHFRRVVTCFEKSRGKFEGQIEGKRKKLLLSTHLNLALCYLKTEKYLEAKNACTEALTVSENNEKAFFRRGQANIGLSAPEEALKDFEEAVKANPKNTAAINQVALCKKLCKQQLAREKRMYGNMFKSSPKEADENEE